MTKIMALMLAVIFSLNVPSNGLAQNIDLSLVPDSKKKTVDRRADL